jgi:hypothetical protein
MLQAHGWVGIKPFDSIEDLLILFDDRKAQDVLSRQEEWQLISH